jgi:hypothetical protein
MWDSYLHRNVLITLPYEVGTSDKKFCLRFWRVISMKELAFDHTNNVWTCAADPESQCLFQLRSEDREELLNWLRPLLTDRLAPLVHVVHVSDGKKFDLWTSTQSEEMIPQKKQRKHRKPKVCSSEPPDLQPGGFHFVNSGT